MLWMMLKHFKSDPERANVLDTRKFLMLQMKGNDLQGYLTQWDKMLFELGSKKPPRSMLKMLFIMNTEKCTLMADVYKRFREVPAGHKERSYSYLINKARTILNVARREKMYAAEQAAAGIIVPGMPAHGTKGQKGKGKGDGKGKGKGGKDGKGKGKDNGKGNTSAPKWNDGGTKPDQPLCKHYLAGTCTLGIGCKWNHCKKLKDEQLAKGYGTGKLGKGKGKGKKGKGKSAAPAEEQWEAAPGTEKKVCDQWTKDGSCTYGNNCKYERKGQPKEEREAASKKQKAMNALAAQTSQKVLNKALAESEKAKAKPAAKPKAKAAAAPAEMSKSAKKKARKIANAAAAAIEVDNG